MAIPTRYESDAYLLAASLSTNYSGGQTNYIIETPIGAVYLFFIDENSDPAFIKSSNGGMTWGSSTVLKNITCTQLAVWYDYWTDPTGVIGGLIHVVYTDSGSDDVYYRTVDTANSDALGTERTPFAGGTTANGGTISVSRMIGGNVIVAGCIDAGAEPFTYKTADLGVNWTSIASPYEASPDRLIMMPGWGADTQDAMCFYYDNSASEISVKYYDDSGDSWSEVSIATTIVHPDHTSTTLGHWSATIDHTNSQNLLAFWTAVDTANADLRVFKVTQSAQTETASNVVLNSTDDQGFCGISIFGSDWYVLYGGASDGTTTYNTALNVYYKKSTDAGVNWGSETKISNSIDGITVFFTSPIVYKRICYYKYYVTTYNYFINTNLAIPHTTFQLGM